MSDLSLDEQPWQRPSVARIYDVLLGGVHHTAVDRAAAEVVLGQMPDLAGVLRADRALLGRVVRRLCAAGIRQFLDLGSGLPTMGQAHEHTNEHAPTARVVYVDLDPVAVAIGEQVLAGHRYATMVRADLRDPGAVLADPLVGDLIDPARPVGVLMIGVLHLLADDEDPAGVVAALADVVAPGSYLAVSHMGPVERQTPVGMARAKDTYRRSGGAMHPRSPGEIEALLAGWQLRPPGLVAVPLWCPDPDTAPLPSDVTFPGLAALAYRTAPPPVPGARRPTDGVNRRHGAGVRVPGPGRR